MYAWNGYRDFHLVTELRTTTRGGAVNVAVARLGGGVEADAVPTSVMRQRFRH